MFLKLFKKKKIRSDKIKTKKNNKTLSVSVATNIGKIRKTNEDNYFAGKDKIRTLGNHSEVLKSDLTCRRIFAVFDGMGGESYGDIASHIAALTLFESVSLLESVDIDNLTAQIDHFASEANNRICDMIDEKKCSRSGSTMALICIDSGMIYAYNIGDSRIYFFNNGDLTQISEDQTLAVKKLKANIYTEEEARNSKDAHKITSYIGVDDRRIGLHALAYDPFDIADGTVLLCSDGLTDMCSDSEISDILSDLSNENPAQTLIDKALENGGSDNITCIVVRIGK